MEEALFPYAGTDGHSGTDTSRAAADEHHATAGDRQAAVLMLMQTRGARGVTVVDIRNTLIPHHGTASRVLTVLHVGGKIERLKESRDGAKIYVLPSFRMGRVVEPYRKANVKYKHQALQDARSAVERLKSRGASAHSTEFSDGWSAALGAVLGEIYKLEEDIAGVKGDES